MRLGSCNNTVSLATNPFNHLLVCRVEVKMENGSILFLIKVPVFNAYLFPLSLLCQSWVVMLSTLLDEWWVLCSNDLSILAKP